MRTTEFDFDQWAALARMDMAKFEQRRQAALDAAFERIGGKDMPHVTAVRKIIEAGHGLGIAHAAPSSSSAEPATGTASRYVAGTVQYADKQATKPVSTVTSGVVVDK